MAARENTAKPTPKKPPKKTYIENQLQVFGWPIFKPVEPDR